MTFRFFFSSPLLSLREKSVLTVTVEGEKQALDNAEEGPQEVTSPHFIFKKKLRMSEREREMKRGLQT